ncbi:zinc finger protein 414 [Halichoeres trimaculatus]|uniref:zinc finger protein 414 n=1 Tax=Halichoeres trimaculatus TaxID=147232 RepID=UPI003D9E9B79
MSAGSAVLQAAENGNGAKQRTPCPLHGCKRVYTDTNSLEAHIKDHEIPAESLPGKVMLCSTIGCDGSFPNMQKLMEHMRQHHKPNMYFLCENCRTKLRSYKGLLTHLHTCSKVPRGKTKPEPAPPGSAVAAPSNLSSMAMDQDPPRLESMSTTQQLPPQIQNTDSPLPATAQPDSIAPPHLGPPFLPEPDPSPPQLIPQQLTVASSLPQLSSETSEVPPSLNLEGDAKIPEPPEAQHQTHRGSHENPHPGLGSAPQSAAPSAVWKKNQAVTSSRRVLWEHTRGRYTCVQCGYVGTSRKEMTQHISTLHSGIKPAEDPESSAAMS